MNQRFKYKNYSYKILRIKTDINLYDFGLST